MRKLKGDQMIFTFKNPQLGDGYAASLSSERSCGEIYSYFLGITGAVLFSCSRAFIMASNDKNWKTAIDNEQKNGV